MPKETKFLGTFATVAQKAAEHAKNSAKKAYTNAEGAAKTFNEMDPGDQIATAAAAGTLAGAGLGGLGYGTYVTVDTYNNTKSITEAITAGGVGLLSGGVIGAGASTVGAMTVTAGLITAKTAPKTLAAVVVTAAFLANKSK